MHKSVPKISTMAEKLESDIPAKIRQAGFDIVYGHISDKIIAEYVPNEFKSGSAWISGPAGFVVAAKKAIVQGAGLPSDKVIPLD